MRELAKYMAAQGRNGDTHLVHVSTPELAALHGLASLSGRRITTNPDTGLPEAFSLTSLIPMIVGIGASVMSGGTLSPLMTGLISGAATTAATGSLSKGLMAGISGGAMSGLGAGISSLGETGAGAGLGGAGGAMGQAGDYGLGAASAPVGEGFNAGAMPVAEPYAGAALPPTAGAVAPAGTIANPGPFNPGGFSGSTFAHNVTDTGKLGDAFGEWGSKKLGGNLKGGAMALGSIASAMGPAQSMPVNNSKPSKDAYKRHITTATYTAPSDPYYAMNGSEPDMFDYQSNFNKGVPQHFADGGIAALNPPTDSQTLKTVRLIRSRYRSKKAAVDDMQTPGSVMQQVGVTSPDDPIMQYAFGYTTKQGTRAPQDLSAPLPEPKYMAGGGSAGDGMSDSIPATIDGTQPARLAASEFVIPSDVVSHIGNGSSDAGAEKLQAMMARVRKARTGSSGQAPAINSNRMLPA